MKKNSITDLLQIEFPIVMAPMFLVSNLEMLKAGMRAGVMSVFPSLNYRDETTLSNILDDLNAYHQTNNKGNYGVNLIVQKTNPYYRKHLQICADKKVPFYITSLGNPKEVVEVAHSYGAKVFCDVINIAHAQKCINANCDGFIAVGQGAGGHAGPNPLQVLVPSLKNRFPNTPIIAAGGIVNGAGLLSVQVLGAEAVSIGTRFIVSKECTVSNNYKQAIIKAGMEDIVMTTKLSGTPCTIINTPTAKEMGYDQSWFEKFLSHNPQTKRWFKMLIQVRGMKKLEQSILPNNYLKLWCAGKSSELIHTELTCEEIISQIKQEYQQKLDELKS